MWIFIAAIAGFLLGQKAESKKDLERWNKLRTLLPKEEKKKPTLKSIPGGKK